VSVVWARQSFQQIYNLPSQRLRVRALLGDFRGVFRSGIVSVEDRAAVYSPVQEGGDGGSVEGNVSLEEMKET
jgi:hypothetical protein